MTAADKSGDKQRGRPFQKGQSGNPKGRALGSRNKATIVLEKMLDGEAEAVFRKVVEEAKAGDMTAARIIAERVYPPRKGHPIALDLPRVETAADLVAALGAVVQAMAGGTVTPDEAAIVAGVLEAKRKAIETVEIEKRLAALEQKAGVQ